jgi:hypothetical protein
VGFWFYNEKHFLNVDKHAISRPTNNGYRIWFFEINNNQLLKLPEFDSENQIVLNEIKTRNYKGCIKLNKEILQLLESEINKNK